MAASKIFGFFRWVLNIGLFSNLGKIKQFIFIQSATTKFINNRDGISKTEFSWQNVANEFIKEYNEVIKNYEI